jgi:hypothetical protein
MMLLRFAGQATEIELVGRKGREEEGKRSAGGGQNFRSRVDWRLRELLSLEFVEVAGLWQVNEADF